RTSAMSYDPFGLPLRGEGFPRPCLGAVTLPSALAVLPHLPVERRTCSAWGHDATPRYELERSSQTAPGARPGDWSAAGLQAPGLGRGVADLLLHNRLQASCSSLILRAIGARPSTASRGRILTLAFARIDTARRGRKEWLQQREGAEMTTKADYTAE